jgi:hypothetical protein
MGFHSMATPTDNRIRNSDSSLPRCCYVAPVFGPQKKRRKALEGERLRQHEEEIGDCAGGEHDTIVTRDLSAPVAAPRSL